MSEFFPNTPIKTPSRRRAFGVPIGNRPSAIYGPTKRSRQPEENTNEYGNGPITWTLNPPKDSPKEDPEEKNRRRNALRRNRETIRQRELNRHRLSLQQEIEKQLETSVADVKKVASQVEKMFSDLNALYRELGTNGNAILRRRMQQVQVMIRLFLRESDECLRSNRIDRKRQCIRIIEDYMEEFQGILDRTRSTIQELEASHPTLENQVRAKKTAGMNTLQRHLLEEGIESSVKKYLRNRRLNPKSREHLANATRRARAELAAEGILFHESNQENNNRSQHAENNNNNNLSSILFNNENGNGNRNNLYLSNRFSGSPENVNEPTEIAPTPRSPGY